MTKLTWGAPQQRRFEAGVDHGILFLDNNGDGDYNNGVAWNGLTAVNETPSGGEATPTYADNIKYLNIQSAEEFGATIEALTYPDEFEECDGARSPAPGVSVGQQGRRPFCFAYRTNVGDGTSQTAGRKLNLVWNCLANPSEKAHSTINDSPEAQAFSWEVTTTPEQVGTIGGVEYNPTSIIKVDSTRVPTSNWNALVDIVEGTAGQDPRMPSPAEVIALFEGALTEVTTVAPSYNPATDTITIPSVTGVVYEIDNEPVTGSVVITADTVVTARPADGYRLSENSDNDWSITFS